jgi:hypothetical protein
MCQASGRLVNNLLQILLHLFLAVTSREIEHYHPILRWDSQRLSCQPMHPVTVGLVFQTDYLSENNLPHFVSPTVPFWANVFFFFWLYWVYTILKKINSIHFQKEDALSCMWDITLLCFNLAYGWTGFMLRFYSIIKIALWALNFKIFTLLEISERLWIKEGKLYCENVLCHLLFWSLGHLTSLKSQKIFL